MELTSQTSIASWLVPFFPCWVNKEANWDEPLRKILSWILWRGSFPQYSKEEALDPSFFLLFFLFFLKDDDEEGELGWGLLLSVEKQDPIFRALRMLIKQSSPPEQKLSSLDESVTTHLTKTHKNWTFFTNTSPSTSKLNSPLLFLNFYYN